MARTYSRMVTGGFTSGVLALSGAAPQTANGKSFDTKLAQVGSLSAEIDYDILTLNITFTASWQVSKDGTNWITASNGSQNAASVAFATGTGAQVAGKTVIPAPKSVYAFPYARCNVATAAASGQGAGKDDVTVLYGYVKSFNGS